MAAGALLPGDERQAVEIGEASDRLRVAGRHHQPLGAPRPFQQHDRHAGHGAPEVAAVPVLGLGLVDVQSGRDRLACREPGEAIEAAVEERRELAAGLAQRPFEQRIVAAGEHRRAAVEPFGAAA